MALQKSLSTERVVLNSGGKDCEIFCLEVTGEVVLIRKTEVEETQFQSTFRSRTPSLQSATKFHFRDANFLTNRDRVLSVIWPLLGGLNPSLTVPLPPK